MKPNIVDAETYEALVIDGLKRSGLRLMEAREMAKNRFPLNAESAICECMGRGLVLDLQDLTDFLRWKFKAVAFDDGEPLKADSVGWIPRTIEELLHWAVQSGRGKPTDEVCLPPRGLTSVESMLAGLRAPDMPTRMQAGFTLARSLGVGLAAQGERREDVEFISGPAISNLIGRAIYGEAEALEEIEARVTATRPPARTREQEQEAN
jgi:hypothetical protein